MNFFADYKLEDQAMTLASQTGYEVRSIQQMLDAGKMAGLSKDKLSELVKSCHSADEATASFGLPRGTHYLDFALRQLQTQALLHGVPQEISASAKLARLAQSASTAVRRETSHLNRAGRRRLARK